MSKREVWVVEDGGEPTGVCIHLENVAPERQGEFVRYVPESIQPAERDGEWVPVADWPDDAGCVAIGYDVFYGRVGEVERRPGSTRWVFIDSQKDDCDVTMVHALPAPPQPKGTK